MFDQIKQLGALVKNAGAIREKAEQMKAELERKTVEGSSGGGAVRVTANGRGRILRVELDPPLLQGIAGGEKRGVEQLIVAAVNEAQDKAQELTIEQMQKITGGMDLPGLT